MAQKPLVVGQTAKLLNFKANDDLVEAIDERAKQSGRNRSELIREAVCRYLEQEVAAS